MSDWLIEDLSGLYVVTAPGCQRIGHPEVSACDCAAFLTRVGAEEYVSTNGFARRRRSPANVQRPRKSKEQREREHAEWLAWRETRNTHTCDDCGRRSTRNGLRIHQRASGHAGISAIQKAPA